MFAVKPSMAEANPEENLSHSDDEDNKDQSNEQGF